MSDVFLSYSHDDHARAKEVAERLEAEDISVWWDNDLRAGRFTEQIERELAKARCVVVLWSNTSGEGDWVPAEADRGRIENKLVQVRLDPGCKVPMPFDRLHILELTDWSEEQGEEEFRAVVEAARQTAKRSPLVRKLARAQRLWQPKPVSQLRPWDTWLGTMLLLAGLATVGVYAYGFFHHTELALYLALWSLVWTFWLVLRALMARKLSKRQIAWRKVLLGVAAVGGLGVLWILGFRSFYAVEPFEDGVRGFYVARLNGDRWDRQQARAVRVLEGHIDAFGLGSSLKVKALPRRDPDSEDALRFVVRGNAVLLLAGGVPRSTGNEPAGFEARLVQREGPGFVRGRQALPGQSAFASQASADSDATDDLLAAVALFFAGYAEYLEGPPYGTAATWLDKSLELLRTLGEDDLSPRAGLGVADSFLATAALFLGNCRFEQKRLDEALELYEEARDVTADQGRNFFEALTNIASVHVEARRFDEAHETLKEASCRTGRSTLVSWLEAFRCAYLHHGLGVTLTLRGQHEEGRARLAEAVAFTQQALDAGTSREDIAALQSLSQQKWAWSAAKQVEKRLVENSCTGTACSDLLSESEESLERAALSWPQGQGLAPFRITRARLGILNGEWQAAEEALVELQTEGADSGEPEVLLLLAVARMCGESAADPGASLSKFTQYEGTMAGMHYLRYWSNRCPPEGEMS